mmetsp:Transcript_11072/g.47885  ORF Transcript_11072/g.47885 Transcript_11072/m.47885 type:complete len:221 (-) Transcript_11072:1340-2002(-)
MNPRRRRLWMPRRRLRARDPGRATTSPGLTRWNLSRRLAAGSTRWWRRRRTSSPATTTTTAATTTTTTTGKISRAEMPPRGCRPRVRSRPRRRSRRRGRRSIRRMSERSARGRNAKLRLSAGIHPRGPGRRRMRSRLVAAFAPVASCPSPRCTSSPRPADSRATAAQPAVTTTRIPNRTGTVRNRSNRGREGKRRPSRKRRSASATRRSARGPCRSSTAR